MRWVLLNLAVAVLYFLLGRLGLQIALPPGYSSLIWPTAGLGLVASLHWGRRQMAPGVFAGGWMVNAIHGFFGGSSFDASWLPLVIASGSCLEVFTATRWLRRVDPEYELNNAASLLRVLGVLSLATLIAPTVGQLALCAKGIVPLSSLPMNFLTWWAGDLLGMLLFAPLGLCLLDRRPLWRSRRIQVILPQLIALTLCSLVFLRMKSQDETAMAASIQAQADSTFHNLRMVSGNHQKEMASLATAISIHPTVTQQEFSALSQALLASCPGLRSWDWVPLVQPGPTSTPLKYAPGWRLHPSGWRAPVRFIAPLAGNETAVGFDQLAQPDRAKLVLTACSTRSLASSPMVHLQRSPVGHRALLLAMPVLKEDTLLGIIRGVIDLEPLDSAIRADKALTWSLLPLDQASEGIGNGPFAPPFPGNTRITPLATQWQDTLQLGDHSWLLCLSRSQLATPRIPHVSNSQQLLFLALLCCVSLGFAALLFSGEAHRIAREVRNKTRALEDEARQRQELTEHLQASMDQYDLLVETISVGIYTFRMSPEGAMFFDYTSPRFCQILDLDRHALAENAMRAFAACHPEDQAGLFLATQVSVSTLAPFRWEGRFLIRGQVRWIRLASDLVRRPDGHVVANGIISDVTEEHEIASALSESEERFRDLFDNVPMPMWVFEKESLRFITVNRAALSLYGYSQEEFLSMTLHDLRPPTEQGDALEESLLRAGSHEFQGIRRHLTKDGRILFMDIATHEVIREGRALRMAALNDVTEQLRAQRELLAAKDVAEAASRAKSEFLANMSHEIRTPMNAILGMIHLSLSEELPASLRDRLTKTHAAAKTLLTILNDILDFSKIESGRLSLEEIPFDLDECLQTLQDLFAQEIAAKGLAFSIEVAPDVPRGLCGDPYRTRQILSNLLGNAIKFTKAGSIRVQVESEACDDLSARLRFAVTDTGIGIAPDQLDRLFQPFTQADTSTTRLFGGTGLGLVISRSLVHMLGGDIGLSSHPGSGSSFFFTATFRLAANASDPSDHPAPSPSEAAVRATILLVEDNQFNQEVAKGILELEGHEVVIASHGQEALDLFPTRRFDIVLMDLHMPVMGGAEATRALRRLPEGRSVPVIALTAAATAEDIELTRECGMDAHISKPFDPAGLAQILQGFLQEGRTRKE